jgi:hypothetical protein
MANITEYQTHIENLLKEYSHYKPSYGEISTELVFDREHNHYMLVNIGWHDDERVSGCVLHLDIKDDKIWIQQDGTEKGITNELVTKGIPKEDIVLAYHAPYMRKHTGFAVG